MSAIITINDSNILIQNGEKLASSQGFAWLLDNDVHFDLDDQHVAISVCRLQPQQIHNRYWHQCARTSIGIKSGQVSNSADLIWRHLDAIRGHHKLKDVVFVVPSHYQADNLQLLLGIATSCGLQPQGLVNKAVVVAQHYAQQDGKYLHIDLQLHQTVCSLVEVRNGVAKLLDIDVLNDVSIQAIEDALLKAMQQSFIQSDRFDPLHYAETEQQLFDQLGPTAQALNRDGKAMVVVQHQMHSYNTAIDSNQWNAVIAPFADKLFSLRDAHPSTQCLLQLNKLFGGAAGSSFDRQTCTLVEDELRIQTDLSDTPSDDGFAYQTELPLITIKSTSKNKVDEQQQAAGVNVNKDQASQANKQQGQAASASHLMHNGLAVPLQYATLSLEQGQLTLARSGSSNLDSLLAKQHVFILSDTTRQSVQLNDRIGSNHADGVITAIRVIE